MVDDPTSADSCSTIPEETAGPFPGDGSNGPNALTERGIVRSDIRSSFGSAASEAEGVLLTIELTIVDTAAGCAAFEGVAVYLWHCDREGRYSMYSSEDVATWSLPPTATSRASATWPARRSPATRSSVTVSTSSSPP